MPRHKKRPAHEARWKRIQEAMAVLGIKTQKELARTLGVKQPSVSGWKSGAHEVEPENMTKLAELSGFCFEYLWMGRGSKFPENNLPEDVQQVVELLLDRMPPERRAEVLNFARFRAED